MDKAAVVIGIGEMGDVFAGEFLRRKYPVRSVIRNMDLSNAG
jgi:prephenate dehydrogenase